MATPTGTSQTMVPGQTPSIRPSGVGGGQFNVGQFGSIFRQLASAAPNAPIKPPTVGLPSRGEFGSPTTAPTIADPSRVSYGLPSRAGIGETASTAREAYAGFRDPTHTSAFTNLMSLAGEQTAAAASEQSRRASDVAQRRGYAGGFEDTARAASQDRMQALAMTGFAGAQAVQAASADMYGKAIGAFTELQKGYNDAMTTGNVAYAHDLTQTHIQNAENALKTAGLNQQQQLQFADSLNQARQLQATLNEQYNKDLIDNARYIQANAQIAAQLAASLAALQERGREFDIGAGQFEETRADTRAREAAARQQRAREFDVGTRQFEETRQDQLKGRDIALRVAGRRPGGDPWNYTTGGLTRPGGTFTGLA